MDVACWHGRSRATAGRQNGRASRATRGTDTRTAAAHVVLWAASRCQATFEIARRSTQGDLRSHVARVALLIV
jgi:hypothetical protein